MALPDLIEIVPLDKPVRAEITVSGSKSITNRALILAALADGEVTLEGALWSEDTQVMTEALLKLGFEVKVENDPNEFCNRRITVKGRGGKILNAGTPEKPLELFVGNAGTAARFLAAMVCLGKGVYRLSGVPRMHERPQAELFRALRELGYRVDSANDKLPAVIHGQTRNAERGTRSCTVSISESSQFASALLLSARRSGWAVKVAGDDEEEAPYVRMTEKLVEVFPWTGGRFQIEPDASSGSYFLAAKQFAPRFEFMEHSPQLGVELPTEVLSQINVPNWPKSGWQVDQFFEPLLSFGLLLVRELQRTGKGIEGMASKQLGEIVNQPHYTQVSRARDLGDSIMTAIILAADLATGSRLFRDSIHFTDLGRLRVQECERVVALRTELTKCGAKVVEEGDMLTVFPSELRGAEIETYNDHRMAMCFAILGLKVPGIKLKNPACVKKTFPNFFQKLAAPPPNGLGVEIWEVKDGQRTRKLEGEDLFAE